MRRMSLMVVGIVFVLAGSCVVASAQLAPPPPSLTDELATQYKVSKLGADSTGTVVTDAGTVLIMQKGGVMSFQQDTFGIMPTKYEGGTIHSPNALAMMMVAKKVSTKFLTKDEKVYVTKIDVNPKNEKIMFTLVECDTCNNVQNPSGYKAQLVFQFAKGYLETATPAQVEEIIGQVLGIDNTDNSQQQAGNQQGGQDQQQQGGGQGQQGGAPAATPDPPVNIEIGQTSDQVKAALGDPQKTVNLKTKQIWVYKDLKITFVNGKVTDVQ